jgi:hypothetical protein
MPYALPFAAEGKGHVMTRYVVDRPGIEPPALDDGVDRQRSMSPAAVPGPGGVHL